MRVEVSPRQCSVRPGEPTIITVSVANTGTVISGHQIRVLGVDPRWFSIDQERLSLFPDTAGVAVVTVTLPRGVPAGRRSVAIEVTELTPPHERVAVDVEMTVPAEPGLKLALDPVSVTGGRQAAVAVAIENTGNSTLDVALDGRDETGEILFRFADPAPAVGPGEQRIATAVLRAPRPWFGSPKVRTYTVVGGPPGAPVIAGGSWLQKARLSRGALALVGLLAAATVFAVVIGVTLSQVVTTSNADRNLALQVAQANQAGNAHAGTAGVSGTVLQQSTGAPVSGVTVEIFQATDVTNPIVSTATGNGGGYHFSGLAAGAYKLQFQGAGFASLWYPDSLSADGATPVTLTAGKSVGNVDIQLGGLPGTISGQVVGADPSGAVLTLEVPGAGGAAAAATAAQNAAAPGTPSTPATAPATTAPAATGPADTGPAATGANAGAAPVTTPPATTPATTPPTSTAAATATAAATGARTTATELAASPLAAAPTPGQQGAGPTIVTTQTLSSSGDFSLGNVPSPGTFYLVVIKAGYAPAVQQVNLGGGETRSGVVISLHKGDGSISGTVATAAGPLGGATIAASDGSSTVSTVSETAAGHVGEFVLSDLPTPDTLTVVVTAPGYTSQTLSLSVAAHQQLTGVSVLLSAGTGSVSGTVTTAGHPAGGVTVTATDGQSTVSTVTLSEGAVGTYTLSGLTDPGDYTLTFSRPDLTSQTRAVSLTPTNGTLQGVDADLSANTAAVYGTITQAGGQPVHQVTVLLSSGTSSYQVVSADLPAPGAYEIDGVVPGTYTISFTRQGGRPVSSIVTLQPGQRFRDDVQLAPAASIFGKVVRASDHTQPVPQAQVTLYLATQYPTVSVATVTTDGNGQFTFANVDAPQDYVLAVAYPAGGAPQETVIVRTLQGQASPVCGSQATGSQSPLTTTTSAPGPATCDPTTDPLTVVTP